MPIFTGCVYFHDTGRNFYIVVPVFREVSCMFCECLSAVNYKVSFTVNHLVMVCVVSSLQVLPLTKSTYNSLVPRTPHCRESCYYIPYPFLHACWKLSQIGRWEAIGQGTYTEFSQRVSKTRVGYRV